MLILKLTISLFLIFNFQLLYSQNYQNVAVISDFDDTYKLTNTKGLFAKVWNGLFTEKIFFAMPDLYKIFEQNADTLVFISNSTTLITKRVVRQITESGLSNFSAILHKSGNKFNYKYQNIERIMAALPNSKFILLGDDSGDDHDIYALIAKNYPDRILRIYIRQVKGKTLPEIINVYYTAYDIAFQEFKDGRIEESRLILLGRTIKNSTQTKLLFPDYVFMPKEFQISDSPELVEKLRIDIFDKLKKIRHLN